MELLPWENSLDDWLHSGNLSNGCSFDESPKHEGPPRGTGKRKGHRKSRGGCLNCKSRKIKCSETRPTCNHCSRGNLVCRYASDLNRANRPSNEVIQTSLPHISLQSTPTLFTMDDMKAFHHFMIVARPHLPLGMDHTWLTEIPKIAHQREYLMHAILALGAAHLSLLTPQNNPQRTEGHRLRAVKGLNEAMSKDLTIVSAADADAMLATVYTLTFESAFTGSNVAEFFTLVRGCASITVQIILSQKNCSLRPQKPPNHVEIMKEKMIDGQIPVIDYHDAQDALDSLTSLSTLPMKAYQIDLVNHLSRVVSLCQTSSSAAYFQFIKFYDLINALDSQQFQDFIDPNEPVSLIIQGEFVGIEALIAPLIAIEVNPPMSAIPGRSTMICLKNLLDPRFPFVRQHLEWPIRYCARLFGADLQNVIITTKRHGDGIVADSKLTGVSGNRDLYKLNPSPRQSTPLSTPSSSSAVGLALTPVGSSTASIDSFIGGTSMSPFDIPMAHSTERMLLAVPE